MPTESRCFKLNIIFNIIISVVGLLGFILVWANFYILETKASLFIVRAYKLVNVQISMMILLYVQFMVRILKLCEDSLGRSEIFVPMLNEIVFSDIYQLT